MSGFYFSHPDAKYFGTGKIQKDQVEDYAKRKGENIKVVERWLAPVLDYDVWYFVGLFYLALLESVLTQLIVIKE